MPAVKVLAKGQITLPKEIRDGLGINEGDTLVVEKAEGEIKLKKGRTIRDYVGVLPRPRIPIEEAIERATKEALKERV